MNRSSVTYLRIMGSLAKLFATSAEAIIFGNLFNAAWLDDPAEKPFLRNLLCYQRLMLTREHRTECAAFLKTLQCYHEKPLTQSTKNFPCPTLVKGFGLLMLLQRVERRLP